MKMAQLGFLFAISMLTASAQPMPWIDISGPWKMALGDDPQYAQPDFDDSSWQTVTLPGDPPRLQGPVPGQFLWLRRSVDLPPGLEGRALALTLGKLTENYELYINGARLASIGDFTSEQTTLARPRTFDLPVRAGSRIHIAVRGDGHQWRQVLSLSWINGRDPGPYVITGTENAPRMAGASFLAALRLNRSRDLVSGVALLGLSLAPLLILLYDRSQLALLWLGLHALALSARRLQIVLLIEPDARILHSVVNTAHLHYVLLMEFVAASLGIRVGWFRALPWAIVVSVCFPRPWPGYYAQTFRVIEFLFVALLLWASRPGMVRRPGHWLIVAGSALTFLSGARGDYSAGTFLALLPRASVISYSTLTSIFTLAMVLWHIRQLLNDRLEKQRLAGDLEAARMVQNLMLSPSGACAGEYVVDSVYQPAQEVGGDFHWSRTAPDGSLLVVVGDVSGKGLKAAMLASVAIGMLRNEKSSSPAAVLAALNEGLTGQAGTGFVTCCCARFDTDGGATVANAGHPSPYCDGREVAVEGGLPLGVLAGVEYQESVVQGERFSFVSDGVVEAENAKRELFGFERTREISERSAREIVDAAKAWGQNDDITVVTVRRKG